MEDERFLNPLDDAHLAALHYVFLPMINSQLKEWKQAWSTHRIRTARSSPLRMWVAGQLQNPTGIELTSDEINNYGQKGNVKETIEDGDRPIFPPLSSLVPENCRHNELGEQMSSNFGIDKYVRALDIVKQFLY